MALFGLIKTGKEQNKQPEKHQESTNKTVPGKKTFPPKRKDKKGNNGEKALASPYSTLDDKHKSILEPPTFVGANLEVTKQISDSIVTSHSLSLANNTNYSFSANYMKKRFNVGACVASTGVSQFHGIVGIPQAIVKGSLTVIPRMQTGIFKPTGGPMLSSSAEFCLSSGIGAFTGKVSSSPSGVAMDASGSLTYSFNVPINGAPNSFTVMSGCEYCHVMEQEKMNLVSGGIRVTRNSSQPVEMLATMNNLGVITSSVMKTIDIEPRKSIETLKSGVLNTQISPCCELQVNTKTKKSCLTVGLKAQKFDKGGRLVRGSTVSVDTNGRCCCLASVNLGKRSQPDMQLNVSLEGSPARQAWATGVGLSW